MEKRKVPYKKRGYQSQSDFLFDLLNETINFYGEDPINKRAADDSGACQYKIVEEGVVKKCAVGRLLQDDLTEEEYEEIIDTNVSQINLGLLKPEYQDIPMPFLKQLQTLHDFENNWNKDGGLSDKGRNKVEHIRSLIYQGVFNVGQINERERYENA